MDIPALSIAMSMDKVNTQWSLGMMEKSLDMADTVSEDLTKMMESSVTPNLGQSIDVRL